MDAQTIFAALSFVATIILALVVYSFKATLRVAILEAVGQIREDYATKAEVRETEDRLKEQIGLRNEIRRGFEEVRRRGAAN